MTNTTDPDLVERVAEAMAVAEIAGADLNDRAVAAIEAVRAYDVEHSPSEAEIEAVEQSWRGGDGRGETFRESIGTALRAAARVRAAGGG